jgi:hypothetical protein
MNGASHYVGRPNLLPVALTTQSGVSATGNDTPVGQNAPQVGATTAPVAPAMGDWSNIMWELDLTSAAGASGDTLDVYVQTSLDGKNWVDIVHFAQALGNGGAKRYFDKTCEGLAQAEFENGTALAVSTVRHLFGDQYRVRWVIAGSTPVFTFGVYASCR